MDHARALTFITRTVSACSTNDYQHRGEEANQVFTPQLSMLACLIRQGRSVLCSSKLWETERMCTRVLNEEWQEGDGAQGFVGEGEKKVICARWICRSGWAEIPHLCERKTSRTDRADWCEAAGQEGLLRESKKNTNKLELSFGLEMFEEATWCAADTAGGGQRRFFLWDEFWLSAFRVVKPDVYWFIDKSKWSRCLKFVEKVTNSS